MPLYTARVKLQSMSNVVCSSLPLSFWLTLNHINTEYDESWQVEGNNQRNDVLFSWQTNVAYTRKETAAACHNMASENAGASSLLSQANSVNGLHVRQTTLDQQDNAQTPSKTTILASSHTIQKSQYFVQKSIFDELHLTANLDICHEKSHFLGDFLPIFKTKLGLISF